MASHHILHEGATVAIGAGTESISMVQGQMNMNNLVNAELHEQWPGIYMGMGMTAEIVADRYKISREDQDQYALKSQQRVGKAQQSGMVQGRDRPDEDQEGDQGRRTATMSFEDVTIERDECNRPDTTIEGSAEAEAVVQATTGSVTAGNASQLSDGASATVVMSSDRAKELGIKPLGKFLGFAVAGCRPEEMGIGPVFAVPKLLKRHGLTMKDIDIVELNEAFASQLLYCQRQLEIPDEKLNPLGGSISIGHPYGMTGSRMTGQLLRELKRQGKRLGIVTMCVGGGMGMAGLFEGYLTFGPVRLSERCALANAPMALGPE